MTKAKETIHYEVKMGGTMYNEYETRREAIDEAFKYSIGRKDFVPVYKITTSYEYNNDYGVEIMTKKQTVKKVIMLVSGRSTAETKGGFIDYEAR